MVGMGFRRIALAQGLLDAGNEALPRPARGVPLAGDAAAGDAAAGDAAAGDPAGCLWATRDAAAEWSRPGVLGKNDTAPSGVRGRG